MGFTDFSIGIDECKNVVNIVRYPLCAPRAYGITNNEDNAMHVLEHDWPGKNDAKDEDGMQHARFP